MNMLSSSPAHALLVEETTSLAPSTVTGIRDLLRDTALFVSSLSTGGTAGHFPALRASCMSMVAEFSAALDHRGYTEDVRDDAVKAQCALLDETAMQRLPADDRPRWAAQPLQVEKFRQHDAGERVFERLEFRMRERSPQIDPFKCYAAILGLGFLGRYAMYGENERRALIAELNALIRRLRPEVERPLVIEQSGQRFGDWLRRVSPWAIAGIGCAVAIVTWLAWHAALDAQLATLIPQTVKP